MARSIKPRRKPQPIPRFATEDEDEEHEFWATHDTIDHFDWSKVVLATFPI